MTSNKITTKFCKDWFDKSKICPEKMNKKKIQEIILSKLCRSYKYVFFSVRNISVK